MNSGFKGFFQNQKTYKNFFANQFKNKFSGNFIQNGLNTAFFKCLMTNTILFQRVNALNHCKTILKQISTQHGNAAFVSEISSACELSKDSVSTCTNMYSLETIKLMKLLSLVRICKSKSL